MLTATIFDIQRNSYVDGPGIRTTVFFKGCNLRCAWCHNPESQRAVPQMMFYKNRCTGCGRCSLFCPQDARDICGKEYTVDEVLKEVLKDKSFYETSGGGVTHVLVADPTEGYGIFIENMLNAANNANNNLQKAA